MTTVLSSVVLAFIKLRILHVGYYYLPWLGYDIELARIQKEAGHTVLFTASSRIPKNKMASDAGPRDHTHPVDNVLLWPIALGKRIILLPGILWVLFSFRPNVVHSHVVFDLTAVLIAVMKPFLGYRLIYCSHTSDLNTDARSSWWRRVLYWIFGHTGSRAIVSQADHVVAVGENEAAMMAREFHVRQGDVKIIRLGAPAENFRLNDDDHLAARRYLGYDTDGQVVLLHVGGVVLPKRLQDLIQAAAMVREVHDGLRILIVGGGDDVYVDSLRALVRHLGMGDVTRIDGRFVSKEELPTYYAAADIGVWPGAVSIATVEAMAAGLPLIVKAGDAYTEFLTSNQNGSRFVLGDVSSLADNILRIARDNLLQERMGRASRELALSEFDWSSIAEMFVHLYQTDSVK